MEFPIDDNGIAFDKRSAPMVCDFQIKTRRSGSHRITSRLSALEKLSKRPTPSFIYAFSVSDDLEFESAHLIHVAGDFLAFILENLRKSFAKGTRPNDRDVSFDPRKYGIELPVTGHALASHVLAECGATAMKYAAAKESQFETLGYGPQRMKIETTLLANSHDELVDAFLGIKPIAVSSIQGFEERFGISVPMPELQGNDATLEISPHPVDKCEIAADLGDGAVVRFPGDLYMPPHQLLPKGTFRFLFRTKFFDVNVRYTNENTPLSVHIGLSMSDVDFESQKAKPSEWRDYFALMSAAMITRYRCP
ncbi:MAG: hypothetical protein ACK4RV_09045 [Caulobacter sp.]